MSPVSKENFTSWFQQMATPRGVLLKSLRFNDATSLTDSSTRELMPELMDQVWRLIKETFESLDAQRFPPERLGWSHEKVATVCVRRTDGTMLAIMLPRRDSDYDQGAVEKLLLEFQGLGTV